MRVKIDPIEQRVMYVLTCVCVKIDATELGCSKTEREQQDIALNAVKVHCDTVKPIGVSHIQFNL